MIKLTDSFRTWDGLVHLPNFRWREGSIKESGLDARLWSFLGNIVYNDLGINKEW